MTVEDNRGAVSVEQATVEVSSSVRREGAVDGFIEDEAAVSAARSGRVHAPFSCGTALERPAATAGLDARDSRFSRHTMAS